MRFEGALQKRLSPILFIFFILIQGCGGGSGGSAPLGGGSGGTLPGGGAPPGGGSPGGGAPPGGGSPGPAAITLQGVVAGGNPIDGAAITIKDINGKEKATRSDASGRYTVAVNELTPPYILKADLPSGGTLFSVGNGPGVVNIHPFTDLIVTTWYRLKGKSAADVFSDSTAGPPIDLNEVASISDVMKQILQDGLSRAGVDGSHFDLISTPFEADHQGFDQLLDSSSVTVNASGVSSITITDATTPATQTTTLDIDVPRGNILIGTVLISGSDAAATSIFSSFISSIPSTPSAPAIATIQITPASMNLLTGETKLFSAVAKNAAGEVINGVAFTWSIQTDGRTPAAIINGSGQVMGTIPATASVFAASGGITSNKVALTVVAGSTVDITVGSPNGVIGVNFPSVALGINFPSVLIGIQFPTDILGGIKGKVSDAATGFGIAGARVQASLLGIVVASTATDSFGSYQFVGFAPDSFVLDVSAVGFLSFSTAPVQVFSGQTRGVNILLVRNQS